jgi:two-component system, OmpR family, phosphate regulon sensor histidine kinase PhoR
MQFDVDPNRRREMHAAIHDEAKRLARMIDDYLDITKLESGVGPLQLRPVQLPPLLDRAVLLLEPLAAKRGIVVVRRFSGELPLVLANPDLMSRAMTNLIANAIKYSPRSTEVTVTVRADAGLVCIDVSDRGSGIPQKHLGRIFEKFYRVAYVADAETPGTGLGLAMVREIMELHRGAVTVSSASGVGSTFSLRLPLISDTAMAGNAPMMPKSPHILVVDDERSIRMMLEAGADPQWLSRRHRTHGKRSV